MPHRRRTGSDSSIHARLSRREALRNLALVGVAAGATGSLLAACGTGTPGADPHGSAPPGRRPDTPQGNSVSFAGPSGQLHGSWATPTRPPKAAVLVVHDSQGLTPHYTDLVGRFAGAGYATLCVDLLSGLAGPGELIAPTQASTALVTAPTDMLLQELRAGIDELGRRVPGAKVGAVGFGFGGGLLWHLLAMGEPRLGAVADFYGDAHDYLDFSRSHAAALTLYPADDPTLTKAQDNADQALLNANLVHKSVLYDDSAAGFFDDTGPRYNAGTAAEAWQATLDWFSHNL